MTHENIDVCLILIKGKGTQYQDILGFASEYILYF